MLADLAALVAAYVIGSVPVAWAAARAGGGVDLRERGSGNVGANNAFQSASRWLIVPVGIAQIAQGAGATLLGRWAGGDAVAAVCGVAALVANNWNPWLRFAGGRGNGIHIGALLVLSPWALAAFVAVAVAGAVLRAAPQGVALAMLAAPLAAAAGGDSAAIVAGCVALALVALAKRMLGNGPPDPRHPRPAVWMLRLVFDRDIRDREAWVAGTWRAARGLD